MATKIVEPRSTAGPVAPPAPESRIPWTLLLALAAGGVILALPAPAGLPVAGQRMLAIFGFVPPVNAPQNMVCIGTGTFTAGQFRSVGLWITAIGYAMLLLFAGTWWRWLGWI